MGAAGLLSLALVSSDLNCSGNGAASRRDGLITPPLDAEDVRVVLGGLDIGFERSSFGPSVGDTQFTLLIRSAELWADVRLREPRRVEWPPGSGKIGEVWTDRLELTLGFVGTAMLRRSDNEVLISGRTRDDQPVLGRVVVDFAGGAPVMELERLPLVGDFGLVSQLGLVTRPAAAGAGQAEWLLALDARHGALHTVSLETGEVHTLADMDGVPTLEGRRDLQVFQGAEDGVWYYRVSMRAPDDHDLSGDDPPDLLIRDLDPADGRIDGYELQGP